MMKGLVLSHHTHSSLRVYIVSAEHWTDQLPPPGHSSQLITAATSSVTFASQPNSSDV